MSENTEDSFDKICRFFTVRLCRIVIESRQGKITRSRSNPAERVWFNLNLDEAGEAKNTLERDIKRQCGTSYPPRVLSLMVDILLQTAEGDMLPMEIWSVSFDPNTRDPSILVNTDVYHRFSVLLRSVLSASRSTACYKYYVRRQSADSWVFLYSIQPGPAEGTTSNHEPNLTKLGRGARSVKMGHVASPYGTISVQLHYRTNMIMGDSAHSATAGAHARVPTPVSDPVSQQRTKTTPPHVYDSERARTGIEPASQSDPRFTVGDELRATPPKHENQSAICDIERDTSEPPVRGRNSDEDDDDCGAWPGDPGPSSDDSNAALPLVDSHYSAYDQPKRPIFDVPEDVKSIYMNTSVMYCSHDTPLDSGSKRNSETETPVGGPSSGGYAAAVTAGMTGSPRRAQAGRQPSFSIPESPSSGQFPSLFSTSPDADHTSAQQTAAARQLYRGPAVPHGSPGHSAPIDMTGAAGVRMRGQMVTRGSTTSLGSGRGSSGPGGANRHSTHHSGERISPSASTTTNSSGSGSIAGSTYRNTMGSSRERDTIPERGDSCTALFKMDSSCEVLNPSSGGTASTQQQPVVGGQLLPRYRFPTDPRSNSPQQQQQQHAYGNLYQQQVAYQGIQLAQHHHSSETNIMESNERQVALRDPRHHHFRPSGPSPGCDPPGDHHVAFRHSGGAIPRRTKTLSESGGHHQHGHPAPRPVSSLFRPSSGQYPGDYAAGTMRKLSPLDSIMQQDPRAMDVPFSCLLLAGSQSAPDMAQLELQQQLGFLPGGPILQMGLARGRASTIAGPGGGTVALRKPGMSPHSLVATQMGFQQAHGHVIDNFKCEGRSPPSSLGSTTLHATPPSNHSSGNLTQSPQFRSTYSQHFSHHQPGATTHPSSVPADLNMGAGHKPAKYFSHKMTLSQLADLNVHQTTVVTSGATPTMIDASQQLRRSQQPPPLTEVSPESDPAQPTEAGAPPTTSGDHQSSSSRHLHSSGLSDSLSSSDESFVKIDVRPAFSTATNRNDIGALVRDCKTAPTALRSFSQPYDPLEAANFDPEALSSRLEQYEVQRHSFDQFMSSLNQFKDDEDEEEEEA